jgi:DHA1 family multidrug resistance protein-like MFS transporter
MATPRRPLDNWQRTLYIMFVAQFITAVGFSNIFPFLPLYVESLGSRLGLGVELLSGLVISAQGVTMMIASPIWGAVADRYGRKLMVQRAMFGGAVVLALMAYARSAEDLVLLRALQGLITGTVSAANALVASVAPRHRTGYAMGLIQVGLWGGVAIGPLIGGALADALGYRASFTVTAVLLLLAGLLVHFGVRETAVPTASERQRRQGYLADWRDVLSVSGVRWAYGLRFLAGLGNVMIVPIAPLFIATLVADPSRLNTLTGLIIGVTSAATTGTAVYLGRLGDRVGHRRVLLICSVLAGLFYLPQSLVTNPWQLLALRALTGAAVGGIVPTISALLARYSQPGEEGSVYGLDNSILAASRAVAPMVGSAIAVWSGFRMTFVATGLLYLLVALLVGWRLPEAAPVVTIPAEATHD